jgi:chromosome transmission fidelity protein 1
MDFEFPYPPYKVQTELMNEIYQALSTCRGGIFESPTGTGKSLSIICSSFKWLREYQPPPRASPSQAPKDVIFEEEAKDPDYIPIPGSMKRRRNETGLPPKKLAKSSNSQDLVKLGLNEEFIESRESSPPSLDMLSFDSDDELSYLGGPDFCKNMQIIYTSRTHSQLSQFMNEVKKTRYGKPETQMKIVQLASRSVLCINQNVRTASNFREINEKCKECVKNTMTLQSNPAKEIPFEKTCMYYSNRHYMTERILESLIDIEDMYKLGDKSGSCPYYGMKGAIESADVILSPYINVLHRRQRQRLGLSLENTVLIVDEAHNIVESILDAYSNTMTSLQIDKLIQDLAVITSIPSANQERQKLYTRLLSNLEKIHNYTETILKSKASSQFYALSKFLRETNISKIELATLILAIEKKDRENSSPTDNGETTELYIALDFLNSLTENEEDGKILLEIPEERSHIKFKYVLLNPLKPFKELLDQCNCVLLLGGTLEPKEEFLELFSSIPPNKLRIYSCSHVIPPSNLLVASIARGPGSQHFSFTFANRMNHGMLNDLCDMMIDVCATVPKGIVVFFPSYAYMQSVIKHFRMTNALARITTYKSVFFDDKGDSILPLYSSKAKTTGAVLFTVVRGKLSEGINFNDDLGRCVIMIGLPYPNTQDIELQEKMKFWDRKGGRVSGKMLYENMCHKAVNQSIGRAIRHKEDYAVVLLVDGRYEGCWEKRPSWTLNNKLSDTSYEETKYRIMEFFSRR